MSGKTTDFSAMPGRSPDDQESSNGLKDSKTVSLTGAVLFEPSHLMFSLLRSVKEPYLICSIDFASGKARILFSSSEGNTQAALGTLTDDVIDALKRLGDDRETDLDEVSFKLAIPRSRETKGALLAVVVGKSSVSAELTEEVLDDTFSEDSEQRRVA